MPINFPITVITNAQRQAWCQVAQELLRAEHNVIGKWFREGITLEEYQTLRAVVQTGWPYKEGNLPKSEWDRYLKERFEPKSNIINQGICQYKQAIYDAKAYSVNLDDDLV